VLEARFRARFRGPARAVGKDQGDIVDDRLKGLMQELGEAINSSLSESDEIADVITRIKAGGYDVFLVLEATIGLNQRGEDVVEKRPIRTTRSSGEFQMTSQDVKFLKLMRISVDDVKKH
jgi:hypothetical protein